MEAEPAARRAWKPHVQLMSVGLAHLGLDKVPRKDMAWLRGKINEELGMMSVPPVDIIVNAAKLFDPDAGDLRGHSGEHCDNMMAAYNHPKMERLLYDVKAQFENARQPTVRILCFCLKGKHRSVCVCRILAHVLKKKAIVAPTVHLSREHWPRGFCHRQCGDCVEGSTRKEEVLQLFEEWWASL